MLETLNDKARLPVIKRLVLNFDEGEDADGTCEISMDRRLKYGGIEKNFVVESPNPVSST